MFIWNNIFFSFGFDVREYYKDFGGDYVVYIVSVCVIYCCLCLICCRVLVEVYGSLNEWNGLFYRVMIYKV